MNSYLLIEKKYRPEVEGLRALAAILVAVYHVWLGKVSGGVDVFFVISGFLITTSLLSRYEYTGTIKFKDYYLNLARRLFPLAILTLFFTALISYFLLPRSRWMETIKEFFASALYYENWQLALKSVDYLAQNTEASPVQHFWAMSLQGQFYLIWPVVILLAILIFQHLLNKFSFRTSLIVTFGTLFTLSFAYSIYQTYINQPWAYFDSIARMWEFSLGGILAVTISKINLNKKVSMIIGWIGFLAVGLTGILLPVSTMFPGYIALIPTIGAIFILMSSRNAGEYGVHRLLSIKPLVSLGGVSYGIYLIHWPLLIFYLLYTGKNGVTFSHGLIIILLSIIFSYIITNLVEKPIRKIKIVKNRLKLSLIALSFLMPFLMVITIWNIQVQKELNNLVVLNFEYIDIFNFDKELAKNLELDDLVPSPLQSKGDVPVSYADNCHQKKGNSEVIKCYYGVEENPDYVIAIVGGSHSAHWLPTFQEIAKYENIQIVNMTKSGCRFTANHGIAEDCYDFNRNLIDSLIDLNPDIVVTTADIGESQLIPDGYIEQWKKLAKVNIEVFAIRDNGRFEMDPPACIEEFGINAIECIIERDSFMPEGGPWERLESIPENVYYFDTGDFFCEEDVCKSVIGNVLAFRDHGHITTTFAKAFAPYMRPALLEALEH